MPQPSPLSQNTNHSLNGMDGESGTADRTFDMRQHYGPRTLSGSVISQFENRNYRDDPEEHYANDIAM